MPGKVDSMIWRSLYSLSRNASSARRRCWRASESLRLSNANRNFSLEADEVTPRVVLTPRRRFAAGALRRSGLVDPALERRLICRPRLMTTPLQQGKAPGGTGVNVDLRCENPGPQMSRGSKTAAPVAGGAAAIYLIVLQYFDVFADGFRPGDFAAALIRSPMRSCGSDTSAPPPDAAAMPDRPAPRLAADGRGSCRSIRLHPRHHCLRYCGRHRVPRDTRDLHGLPPRPSAKQSAGRLEHASSC